MYKNISLRGDVKLYGLFRFLNDFDLYLPIKIVYLYHLTNSYTIAASIISFTWIFAAILEVPTGVFSDFIGRKRTIILGSFCLVMAYFLYALGFDYWILVFAAFLEGGSKSFFSGNNDAYLHNLLKEEGKENEFHQSYGKLSSLLTVATSTGALLSGFVADWSFAFFMWINLIPQTLAFIISIFLKDIKREERVNTNIYSHLKEAVFEIKNNLNLRYLSLSRIFSGAGGAASEFQVAVYNLVWPTWAIGVARWLTMVMMIPGYYFAGRLINRYGSVNLIMLGTLATWAGNILAGLVQSFLSPFMIIVTHFTYSPEDTAEQNLIQKEFTERQRATIASLNSLGNSLYFSLVAFLCGLIATKTSPFYALIATQMFYLPVIFFKFKLFRRLK